MRKAGGYDTRLFKTRKRSDGSKACERRAKVAETCPQTSCIRIADSDADVYELFCEPRATSGGEVHLLVRVRSVLLLKLRDLAGIGSCHAVSISM